MSKEEYEHGMRDSNCVTITSCISEHSLGLHIAHFFKVVLSCPCTACWVGWIVGAKYFCQQWVGPLTDIISKSSNVNHYFLLMTLCQFNTLKSLEPTKSIRTTHFHSEQVVTNCVTNQYILNYKFNQNLQSLGHISTNLAFRSRPSGPCHLIGFTIQIILKYKHRIIQLNILLCFPT